MDKKKIFIPVAMMCAVILSSCTKQGTTLYKGNYSFKTSGTLSLVKDPSSPNDTSYRIVSDIVYDSTFVKTVKYVDGKEVEVIDTVVTSREISRKDTVVTVFPDKLTVSLDTESGQMDITETGSAGGEMVMTMNVLGGDMIVQYATAEGEGITLRPLDRFMRISLLKYLVGYTDVSEMKDYSFESYINVTGDGRKYGNIVLLDMKYSGSLKYNKVTYNIADSKIDCRAKEN